MVHHQQIRHVTSFFCAITQLYVCLYKKNISLPDAKMKLPQCNDIGTSNDGRSLAALPLSSILRQATTVALTLSCWLPQVWVRKTERDRPELAGHRGTVIFGHPLQTGSTTWKFLGTFNSGPRNLNVLAYRSNRRNTWSLHILGCLFIFLLALPIFQPARSLVSIISESFRSSWGYFPFLSFCSKTQMYL